MDSLLQEKANASDLIKTSLEAKLAEIGKLEEEKRLTWQDYQKAMNEQDRLYQSIMGSIKNANKTVALQQVIEQAYQKIEELENFIKQMTRPVEELMLDFTGLVKKSELFGKRVTIPTFNNRISTIARSDKTKQHQIAVHAQDTYPLLHEQVLILIDGFINFKKQFGSSVEQELYKSLDRESFIDRLLNKRPLMFMTSADLYLLRDGKTKGTGGFETIGTMQEKLPLVLKDYISYDEMQIAALLGVSVPTYFINDGDRNNKGIKAIPGSFEEQGVYVGLVGARFEKPGLMEWQHMVITRNKILLRMAMDYQ